MLHLRIPFEQATREELLIACKGLGFDEINNEAGMAFNRGCDGHLLTVREVQAMICQAQFWGYRSIDITNPNWIKADMVAPSTEEEVWNYLSSKYKLDTWSSPKADAEILKFIRNEALPVHTRFCMILIYEGAHFLEEEDDEIRHELAQDDEYKLQEIADFQTGI